MEVELLAQRIILSNGKYRRTQLYPIYSSIHRKFLYSKEGKAATLPPHESFPVEAAETYQHFSKPFMQIFSFPQSQTLCYPESVKDMIQQLPTSLQHLVNNVTVMASKAETTSYLQLKQPIFLASDGSAIPGQASYEWIIQIGEHQIAKGKGSTFGSYPRSFRAEGYGMASAMLYLRLLQRQIEFTRGPRAVNKVICDKQGLLLRIAKASEWTYTTPNVTLRGKWDVESVILSLQQELNFRFE
jgi:hypothetical protein